jgi:pimeloyl-ACP methyl ester carboxylesterase
LNARSQRFTRFVVVGHDLGQPVAQRLAADHPDIVAGAVFLDGVPQGVPYDRRDPSGRTWYFDFFRQRGVTEQIIGEEWIGAGQKIEPPAWVLWAANGPMAGAPVLELWRRVAPNVRGAEIPKTAQYLQEEQPEQVARHILDFAHEIAS